MIKKGIVGIKRLMLLILVIIIGCLSYAKVTHRPLPIQFFNVLTGSMADTFKPNSLVVVGRVNFEKLKVGDIISYESEKALVTHRIEAITGQGKNRRLVTKGDSNQAIDATSVTAQQVEGKLLFSIPRLGRFGEMIQTKRGQLALVLTVIQVLLLLNFLSLAKDLGLPKVIATQG